MAKKEIDYKAVFDKVDKAKAEILRVCRNAKNESGIYFLLREESGFKYAYIGQSLTILNRLCSHLNGYEQHIDRSLKTHKLYSEQNPCGWKIGCLYFPKELLNEKEQYYIKLYANNGYQLRNHTSGSQDTSKFGISANNGGSGYRKGVLYGEKKAYKRVKEFFDKYLDFVIKGESNKVKERKIKEFEELLKGE